jgi:hypothetical protein
MILLFTYRSYIYLWFVQKLHQLYKGGMAEIHGSSQHNPTQLKYWLTDTIKLPILPLELTMKSYQFPIRFIRMIRLLAITFLIPRASRYSSTTIRNENCNIVPEYSSGRPSPP